MSNEKKIKRAGKKLVMLLFSMIMIWCCGMVAMAGSEYESNDDMNTANSISTGTAVYGNLHDRDDVDYYKFTVGSAGYFNINFNHEYVDSGWDYWYVDIYDSQQQFLFSRSFSGNSIKNTTAYVGVPAGIYYIKVGRDYWSDASYNFTVNFTAANNWETEHNDNFYSPDIISINTTIWGTMITRDDVDYYKFTIPANGYISLKFNHDYVDSGWDHWYACLYDADMQELYERSFQGDSTVNAVSAMGVKAGTYYIKIGKDYWSDVRYNFSIQYTANNNWEKEFNDSFYTANSIKVGNIIYGNIMNGGDEDFYSFYTSTQGKLKITFKHDYIDSGWGYWKLILYNANYQELKSWYFTGNNCNDIADGISVTSGTYFLRIKKDYYSDIPYNFKVNVNKPAVKKVTSIKLNKSSSSLEIGKSLQLKASVSPSNAANRKVTWKSSNTKVATVSSKGLVKTKNYGIATITCRAQDGSGKKATCKITVKPKKAVISDVKISGTKRIVSIKKQSGVSGYQVYVASSKNGKYKKYKTLKNTQRTFKCSSKYFESHYFKVRAFKKIDGKVYYGAFSTPR